MLLDAREEERLLAEQKKPCKKTQSLRKSTREGWWYYTVPASARRRDDQGIDVKTWPGRRRRIRGARAQFLSAAFVAFTKSGYAAASMLEIATRARVSKRELYALVGNKQEMLV